MIFGLVLLWVIGMCFIYFFLTYFVIKFIFKKVLKRQIDPFILMSVILGLYTLVRVIQHLVYDQPITSELLVFAVSIMLFQKARKRLQNK